MSSRSLGSLLSIGIAFHTTPPIGGLSCFEISRISEDDVFGFVYHS